MTAVAQCLKVKQCDYQRRRPEQTTLYKLIQEHSETFFAQIVVKAEPAGFDRYYQIRDERLACLESGFVKVYIEQLLKNGHAGFRLRVEDSGPGFDVQSVMSAMRDDQAVHGRGVALVRFRCHKLNYLGSGNRVEAEYFL